MSKEIPKHRHDWYQVDKWAWWNRKCSICGITEYDARRDYMISYKERKERQKAFLTYGYHKPIRKIK